MNSTTIDYLSALLINHLLMPFDEVMYCTLRLLNRRWAALTRLHCRDAAIIVPLNRPSDLQYLPPHLFSLRVAVNTVIDVELLPRYLSRLNFTNDFNKCVIARHLPPNLEVLTFAQHYCQELAIEDLPKSLQVLKIAGKKVDCHDAVTYHLGDLHLFPALHTLTIRGNNVTLRTWPAELRSLHLTYPVCAEKLLPASLRKLVYDQDVRSIRVTHGENCFFSEDRLNSSPVVCADLPRQLEIFRLGPAGCSERSYSLADLPPTIRDFVDPALRVCSRTDAESYSSLDRRRRHFAELFAPEELLPNSLRKLVCYSLAAPQLPDSLHELSLHVWELAPYISWLQQARELRKLRLVFEETNLIKFFSALPESLRSLRLYYKQTFPGFFSSKPVPCRGALPVLPYLRTLKINNFLLTIPELPNSLRNFHYAHWVGKLAQLPRQIRKISVEELSGDLTQMSALHTLRLTSLRPLRIADVPRGVRVLGFQSSDSDWRYLPRHLYSLSVPALTKGIEDFWSNMPTSVEKLELEEIYDMFYEEHEPHSMRHISFRGVKGLEELQSGAYDYYLRHIAVINRRPRRYPVHADNRATRERRVAKFFRDVEELELPGKPGDALDITLAGYRQHAVEMASAEYIVEEINYLDCTLLGILLSE